MNPVFFILQPITVLLLPIVAGAVLGLVRPKDLRVMRAVVMGVTLLTSAAAWALILWYPAEETQLLHFAPQLTLSLRFDSLGRFFCGIIATLWPMTVLYGFSYMEHDHHQSSFFGFFTIAFGVTLGVSMAGNLFSLYCFYELLTLSTVPLVMHERTKNAVRATKTYFAISLGGAAFAFVSLVYLVVNGGSVEGGTLTGLFWLFGFFGFGVKAAVFPLHVWLPRASVAPTPVTALLHAVAVVKSGVFAIIRLTYFAYGVQTVRGTAVQKIALAFAIFTIIYGAVMAVRESHWKRRLAYSTVANLSYILFGVLLMTEESLSAGLLHMAFHAEIKILAFFCAGAVLHMTGREYLMEMDGMGYHMPVTMGCFMVAALGLTGIPPFAGFVSKWHLLVAAAREGSFMAYLGAGVILTAALLTAMYCFTVLRRAFLPDRDAVLPEPGSVREADLRMLVPMCILAAGILITGLCAGRILSVTDGIATGVTAMFPLWK